MQKVTENICVLLMQSQISVETYAEKIGTTAMTIYSWISHPQRHKPPPYAHYAMFAAYLNLSPVSNAECLAAWQDLGIQRQLRNLWRRNQSVPLMAKLACAYIDHRNKENRHVSPNTNQLEEGSNAA